MKPEPLVPHYICATCSRRHALTTQIGKEHIHLARKPKRS